MQSYLFIFSIVFASLLSSLAQAENEPVQPEPSTATAIPLESGGASAAPLPPVNAKPHIALLLPLKSATFGKAAEMVRQGFMAGVAVQPGKLPVKVYGSSGETSDIVGAYQQATQAGARFVVGPLTRNGVSGLISDGTITVPTLALNQPDQATELPGQMAVFSLGADIEARQVARMAFGEGRKQATVIASDNALAARIQQAFSDEWSAMGGSLLTPLKYTPQLHAEIRSALAAHPPEVLFLALNGRDARLLRPYLSKELPTYATSQIHIGGHVQKYHDLNGVQFVDMPWLLQLDHAAVISYTRLSPSPGSEMERLYALGIDAWRLIQQFQAKTMDKAFKLEGVTGNLAFDKESRQIQREAWAVQFDNGEARLLAPQP